MSETRILVACSSYPSAALPHHGTFVRALVEQWARLQVSVDVIAPRSRWSTALPAFERTEPVDGIQVAVHRPPFLSYSNRPLPWVGSTFHWTVASYGRAFARSAVDLTLKPDIAYGHFLFPSGSAAAAVGRRLRIPAAVALGESSLGYYEPLLGLDRISETLRGIDVIVSVSETNKSYCVERLGIEPERIHVVPNAVDPDRFHRREREAARLRLRIPETMPLVVFTGHFIERKGPLRVVAALRELPDVGAAFLGSGPQIPAGEQVVHAAPVSQDDVPDWLSAADVFVLPTLAEGCPNAVIEAMACGAPVVSSDIPELHETVGEGPALLIDPQDPSAIREAVRRVLEDRDLAAEMRRAGLERAARFTLAARADRILDLLRVAAESHR